MNLHRLVAWADQLLQHSPRGSAAEGSMLAKLRTSLDQLPECKSFEVVSKLWKPTNILG